MANIGKIGKFPLQALNSCVVFRSVTNTTGGTGSLRISVNGVSFDAANYVKELKVIPKSCHAKSKAAVNVKKTHSM
jgi:hypothetical protein